MKIKKDTNILVVYRTANQRVIGHAAKTAFTLAEVLITLGVIGVVAALTLPTLIQNYEKHVTVNRLKVSYNIMSNAIRMAEAHEGEITEWGIVNNLGQEYESASNKVLRIQFANKYLMPYLQGAQLTETTSLAQLGYKTDIINPNGSVYLSKTSAAPFLRLNNGTIVIFFADTTTTPDPVTGKKQVLGMGFIMDIDGPNGKNTIGRDIFFTTLPFVYNTRFMMQEVWGYNTATKIMILPNKTRTEVLQDCKKSPTHCGRLIQFDGWEIKDDYPWW